MKSLILLLAACCFFSCEQRINSPTFHLLDEAPNLDTYHELEAARLEETNY